MAYYIKEEEPIQPGLRRIEIEQLEKAFNHLNKREKLHEAVHKVRRRFKKLRALARLVRPGIGKQDYRYYNRLYRDEARKISDLRDATAMIETLDHLETTNDKTANPAIFEAIRNALLQSRQEEMQSEAQVAELLKEISQNVEVAWDNPMIDTEQKIKMKHLIKGLKRVYARGYKNYRKCQKAMTDTNIHQWRKRAKYLRYHLNILKKAWEPVLAVMEDELHHLTDQLGAYHDLEVLKKELESSHYSLEPADHQNIIQLINCRQETVYQQALQFGARLYAEKPNLFTARLGHYIKTAWK